MTTIQLHLIEKCKHCHLFIEPNTAREIAETDDPAYAMQLAEYVHLHRGDDADEAIENTHEAKASGLIATLATWKEFGPAAMRYRFTDVTDPDGDIIGELLRLSNEVITAKNTDKGDLLGLIDDLRSIVFVISDFDRNGTLDNINEILNAARNVVNTKDRHVNGKSVDWLGAIDQLDGVITETARTISMSHENERVLGADAARAVGRFNPNGPDGYRAATMPDAPLRTTRAEAAADERAWLTQSDEPKPERPAVTRTLNQAQAKEVAFYQAYNVPVQWFIGETHDDGRVEVLALGENDGEHFVWSLLISEDGQDVATSEATIPDGFNTGIEI